MLDKRSNFYQTFLVSGPSASCGVRVLDLLFRAMQGTLSDINEETALLSRPKGNARTPLPKLQLAITMLSQISEPLASQSIYPYINQLISELDITGGDEKKVGYYAGLIESLFFLTQAITVFQWSRASDRIGRKPVLLIGLFGVGSSILCFGLSRTFWGLVVSRCLCGLLNGNIGVMKSTMGDLTDRTNRPDAFALIPIVWAIGASSGALIGGSLARPHERFPELFSGSFWRDFPYFLPCLATGTFVFLSFLLVLTFFRETLPLKISRNYVPDESVVGPASTRPSPKGPLPLRELFIFPVIISVANYVSLAFLNTTFGALQPLFYTMPIEIGGLGLPPSKIGLILSAYGVTAGLFQVFFFARLVRRFGEKRVVMGGIATCLPIFALLPVMNIIAQRSGVSFVIWILIGCVLALGALMETSFGAVFMFLTASAPKSSRGTVNGLAQTSVSLARALGPAMSTSLFSLSVQHNLFEGYMVYLIYLVLSALALVIAWQLPDEIWDDVE
ncbi:major facilitator superfamily domain-containing protein [Mycena maculata]|uniref:Major facilitator superfamily domain-containing protein n=1 Tax=Mycena maculata TaxID=230809 RepID=A0AAD7JEC8_9AGAR|nr:major facilitator superfamily domain-containing protein [Mycena maculata]